MSRAERRAYQRMTKNQDPYAAPPLTGAQKARLDRQRELRTRRPATAADPGALLPGRWLLWLFGGAAAAFLVGLSVAWPRGGGFAAMIGVVAAVAWIALVMAMAFWRRRARLSGPARNRPTGR